MLIPPSFTGLEVVATAGSNASSTAALASSGAQTTSLSYPDAAQWHYSYHWWHGTANTSYSYQPGHTYPAGPISSPHASTGQWDNSWSWYHGPATAGDASTATLAGTANANTTSLSSPDAVWNESYSWYSDTPGAYPDSKMTWYYNNGGLYDQAHQVAVVPPASEGLEKKAMKPTPASPGHVLLCGNALLYGVIDATVKLFDCRDENAGEVWKKDVAASSAAAAAAVSPVGGYFLSHHLLPQDSQEEPEVKTLGRAGDDE